MSKALSRKKCKASMSEDDAFVLNPATGRYVSKTGAIGKKIMGNKVTKRRVSKRRASKVAKRRVSKRRVSKRRVAKRSIAKRRVSRKEPDRITFFSSILSVLSKIFPLIAINGESLEQIIDFEIKLIHTLITNTGIIDVSLITPGDIKKSTQKIMSKEMSKFAIRAAVNKRKMIYYFGNKLVDKIIKQKYGSSAQKSTVTYISRVIEYVCAEIIQVGINSYDSGVPLQDEPFGNKNFLNLDKDLKLLIENCDFVFITS